jgi:glycosyltransferase involved in cell wall biosynthesis
MRVVLDVSTSFVWGRPPVGIVRTEQKFAAFLLEQAHVDVAFSRFDRITRSYREVPAPIVRRLLSSSAAGLSAAERGECAAAPATESPSDRRLRVATLSAVRRGIAALPGESQRDATLVVQSAVGFVKGLYWLSLRAGRAVLRRPPRASGTPIEVAAQVGDEADAMSFQPDDVYVSMGLDWDFNDLETLARLRRRIGFRTVLYCYDVIPVRFPHLMSFDARQTFAKYFVDLAHVADHVVAISEATRDDYRDVMVEVGAPVPEISVIPLGTDLATGMRAHKEPPRPDLADRPFVLCVGTIEARKNHELLYHVWDRLVARHGERAPVLVLVGMVGWGIQDLLSRMQLNPRLAGKIVILDNLPDASLIWLYEHCLFTVYPSFVEGWGLPVVESLALGTPCIASNARAVVEATQGLVPTLDPLDFAAWLDHVDRWSFDPQALRAAADRVRAYRAPSWREHGAAMLDVIRQLSGTEPCASSI